MRPEARREQLVLEELGGELVVYDLERHRAHQLNRAAALVWRNCNGRRTVAELTRLLKKELDPAATEALVWKALDRLGKARLLRQPIPLPKGTNLTRRQVMDTLGRAAVLAALTPVVTSILAPTPVQAGLDLLPPIRRHRLCSDKVCRARCEDECGPSKPCPRERPNCAVFFCGFEQCETCLQRRCVKSVSGFHLFPIKI